MSRHRTNSKTKNKVVNRSRYKNSTLNNARSKNDSAMSQVRIIGGRFKRQLLPFIDAEGLRPTPDRLRETLFNWIQFDLFETNVLDLCAGSGVLGFEALSRGASHATLIELNKHQATLINQTAEKLKLSEQQATIYHGDAVSIIPTLVNDPSLDLLDNHYHIVFVDPPYDLNLWSPTIEGLVHSKLVDETTLFYIEDKRPLTDTLRHLPYSFQTLKENKIGQIYASLIKLSLN